jgi:hypothetical protein
VKPEVIDALHRNGIATPHLAPSFDPTGLQGKKETGMMVKTMKSMMTKTLSKAMNKRAVGSAMGRAMKAAAPKKGSHVTIPRHNHFI